jgi:peroxiredoxin
MNVNCKVALTDDERNKLYNRITGTVSKKMVSRADVNEFVKSKIAEALNGTRAVLPAPKEADHFTREEAVEAVRAVQNFEPSRGDEPYMLKVKDESLRGIHTRMLDCIEEYEKAVWLEIEKNRI